jgi:hypothetical protein
MEYTNDFKTKAFRIFRFTGNLLKIIKAIENNRHNEVRILLENIIDDPKLYETTLNKMGVPYIVKKDKKYSHKERESLYSEFMDNYTLYLDRKNKYEKILTN